MFSISDWTPDELQVFVGWDEREGKIYRGEITDLNVNADGVVGVIVKEAHDFSRGFFPVTAKLTMANPPKEQQACFVREHPKALELFKALAQLKKAAKQAAAKEAE
ncbi:MAG: hypothetical protein IT440_15425 [Phycisphaeraceae bacterium]|nr:hypothetical protein [Phycisphaeraceae bacterium]